MNNNYILTLVTKIKYYLSNLSASGVFFSTTIILINGYLLIDNNSWLFHPEIVEKYGDQMHYFALANNISNLIAEKSLYTLGYPLLYLFFIIIDGEVASWQGTMPYIITIQAFIITPIIIYFIFSSLKFSNIMVIATLLTYYYFTQLLSSQDPLTKYTALGLIPLSEPLAILCLLLSYVLFFRIKEKKVDKKSSNVLIVGLALFIAYTLMTRQTLAILIAPIFIYFLQEKWYGLVVKVMSYSFLFYVPQLIWNYWVSRDLLFSGYSWWNSEVAGEMHQKMIYALYNINGNALFSVDYFMQNVKNLFSSYFFLFVLLVIGRFWQSRPGLYVAVFTVFNIVFYLSYWWSGASGLIDRFLLPNYFLIIFFMAKRLRSFKSVEFKNEVQH